MRVLGKKLIEQFCKKHSRAKGPLVAWLNEAESADWKDPQDIKDRYRHASFPKGEAGKKVIFNIGGNNFRLEVLVTYFNGIVVISSINTHANYDKKNGRRK